MSRSIPPVAVLLAALFGGAGVMTTSAAEFDFTPRPLPEGLNRAAFKLWLPESLRADQPVRGVLCASDYEGGRSLYANEQWRKLAEKLSCGVMLYNLQQPTEQLKLAKSRAAADAILAALKDCAAQAKRPEIEHAHLVLTGLSQSGWQATAFANLLPERVIATVPFHESTAARAPDENKNPAGWGVPQLHVMGGKCFLTPRIAPWVLEARAKGALWGAALQPGIPHAQMGEQEFVLLWLEEVFNARVPQTIPVGKPYGLQPLKESDGWLGQWELDLPAGQGKGPGGGGTSKVVSARAMPFAQFSGDRAKTLWLPNERVARAWEAYCRTGRID